MILALFFTRGVSLETWVETGLFDREKLIYEEHLRRGHLERVYWLTYGSNDAEIAKKLRAEKRLHPGIQVIAMPGIFKDKIGKLIYSFLMPLLQKTCLKQADIYKTNQMDGSWSAVFANFFYGKPLIVRTGYTLSFLAKRLKKSKTRIFIYQLMERLAFKYADRVTVTSKKDKKYISDIYKCPSSKLVVLSNYIDTELFVPLQSEQIYDDRVVYVGRINPQKNLYNLIEACAISKVGLDIIGSEDDKSPLATHAREYGADVRFLGVLSNRKIAEILASYRIFILPSIYEGNPKSLLEAMSCGKAVIGTEVDGIREIIRNEENGLLCGTNADSLADSINRLLYNPELCNRLGESARKYILMTCSLGIIVERELDIYKSILRNEKSR